MTIQYESMPPISREEALSIFALDDPDLVSEALVRLAFHESDRQWVEQLCFKLARHSAPMVKRTAAICLGHLARIHRELTLTVALPLLTELLNVPAVAGVAGDALDDIALFVSSERLADDETNGRVST